MTRFEHRPVMVDEVVEILRPVPPGLVVDATVGAGGHSAALLDRLVAVSADPFFLAAIAWVVTVAYRWPRITPKKFSCRREMKSPW